MGTCPLLFWDTQTLIELETWTLTVLLVAMFFLCIELLSVGVVGYRLLQLFFQLKLSTWP